jgi:hypothetical protein
MDRLTVPDVRVDEHTIRRAFVDVEAVRDRAMEFYWRLKAYEDKELEPEEVLQKDKADEIALKLMRLADLESICSYTRLRELAGADKDGRVVVLPCKVGDTVWFKTYTDNGKTCIGIQPHKAVSARVCVMAEGRIFPVELPLSRFGKSWFLTREEAEKALEAMENG